MPRNPRKRPTLQNNTSILEIAGWSWSCGLNFLLSDAPAFSYDSIEPITLSCSILRPRKPKADHAVVRLRPTPDPGRDSYFGRSAGHYSIVKRVLDVGVDMSSVVFPLALQMLSVERLKYLVLDLEPKLPSSGVVSSYGLEMVLDPRFLD